MSEANTPTRRRLPRARWLVPALAAAVVTGLVALLAYGLVRASEGRGLVSAIAAGERPAAPTFTLPLIWPPSRRDPPVSAASSGGHLNLRRLRGQPVLLNFWASWCKPCQQEAPLLAAAADKYRNVVFVGVDVQDFDEDAKRFLRRYQVRYASVRDVDNETWRDYGLTGVPETYYLNAAGRIVGHTPGPVDAETLDREIARVEQR